MTDGTLNFVNKLNIAYYVGNGTATLAGVKMYFAPKYANSMDTYHNALAGFLGTTLLFLGAEYLFDKDNSSQKLQKRCMRTALYSTAILGFAYKYKDIYGPDKAKYVLGMLGAAAVYNLYFALIYQPKKEEEARI